MRQPSPKQSVIEPISRHTSQRVKRDVVAVVVLGILLAGCTTERPQVPIDPTHDAEAWLGTLAVPNPRIGDQANYSLQADPDGSGQPRQAHVQVISRELVRSATGEEIDGFIVQSQTTGSLVHQSLDSIALAGNHAVHSEHDCPRDAESDECATVDFDNHLFGSPWLGPWGYGSSLFQGRNWTPHEVVELPLHLPGFDGVITATADSATGSNTSRELWVTLKSPGLMPNHLGEWRAFEGRFLIRDGSPYVVAANFTVAIPVHLEYGYVSRAFEVELESWSPGGEQLDATTSQMRQTSCSETTHALSDGLPPGVEVFVEELGTSIGTLANYFVNETEEIQSAADEPWFFWRSLELLPAGSSTMTGGSVEEISIALDLAYSTSASTLNVAEVTETRMEPNPLDLPAEYEIDEEPQGDDTEEYQIPGTPVYGEGIASLADSYLAGRDAVDRTLFAVEAEVVPGPWLDTLSGYAARFRYSVLFESDAAPESGLVPLLPIRWDSRTGCLEQAEIEPDEHIDDVLDRILGP